MKDIVLMAQKNVIKPEDIPAREAVRLGLAFPARKIGNVKLPVIPAGQGVFAKFAVELMNPDGSRASFRNPLTGRLVKKMERPVHSFVRNFDFFIRGCLQNLDSALNVNETLVDSAGSNLIPRVKSSLVGFGGAISGISGLARIKFGDSLSALDNTQFNLQGVLLGPTTFGTVAVNLVVENSTQTIFTVVGQVVNGSGGTFTVQEMGLFSLLGDTAGTANRECMFTRDLTGSVPVNNGQTIIGTYTFTISV